MPDMIIVEGDRFPGDHTLQAVAGYTPTTAERSYLDSLKSIFDRLSGERDIPVELVDEITATRSSFCAELRKYALSFAEMATGPDRDSRATEFFMHTLRLEGGYRDRRRQKLDIPFIVIQQKYNELVNDIIIRTRDVRIPEEKQRLKIDIDRTVTVMKAVLGDRSGTSIFSRNNQQNETTNARKLDEYLVALHGIASVGLMNLDKSQTPFANLALTGLKDEFVAREGGLVKNAYVWRLGACALVTVILCAIFFWLLSGSGSSSLVNFFWLWAGAATGAWLSFSIRRVVLGFADLAILEDDRLTPELRIIFVVALTSIVGLMFWTGMVSVTIGSFTTDLRVVGNRAAADVATAAFLIGAFCGIAERSMASAVARRADDFAAGVGRTAETEK